MLSSTHWIASTVGMALLQKGGNAFDAAVAAGFVLHIVEPHLNRPGGDATILVYSSKDQTVRGLCGQGVALLERPPAPIANLELNSFQAMACWLSCLAHSMPGYSPCATLPAVDLRTF
jgi:gamma-glutamyltranspeptidase / glutathione hydrolase